jgi:hypothetical protein
MCNRRTKSQTICLQHLCKFAFRLYVLIVQTGTCQLCGIFKLDVQQAEVIREGGPLSPAPLALRQQCARYAEPGQSTLAQSVPVT